MVRRTALWQAYDEVLIATCRMVEVSTCLDTVPLDHRAVERVRTEVALELAGVCLPSSV